MNKSIKELEKKNPTPIFIASLFGTCACTIIEFINFSNTLGSNQVLDIGCCGNAITLLSRFLCFFKSDSYTMNS